MNDNEQQLLARLGIIVTDLEYEHAADLYLNPVDSNDEVIETGRFRIDQSRFRPMCHLIKLVDMLAESKNPQIEEQFNHLVTMLFLTEDKKNG